MNAALVELIKISNTAGKDPALVQGGGGNTSVKTADGKFMYVKASGTALKDMSPTSGWRRLKLDLVLDIVEDRSLDRLSPGAAQDNVTRRLLLACDDNQPDSTRPSVESLMHAIMPRCVIHLHPLAVGVFVNARNGRDEIERLFRSEARPPLWIPYANPGFALARKIARFSARYENRYAAKPGVIFLAKHGLIVTAESRSHAMQLLRRTITTCEAGLKEPKVARPRKPAPDRIRSTKLAIRGAMYRSGSEYVTVQHCYDNTVASFLRRSNARRLLSAGPLAPDEMLYAGGPAVWLGRSDIRTVGGAVSRYLEKTGRLPRAFLVKDLGLFIAAPARLSSVARQMAVGSLYVRSHAADMGGVKALTRKEQQFIDNWEAEVFRLQVAAGMGERQLAGRIAVVTGAGSGLGRYIAIGLARAGAIVAVADIDIPAAEQTVRMIRDELHEATAVVLPCNVTDEKEVGRAFDDLLEQLGGLDILVNAAGIAPPGPLVQLPVDKWRQALEVNLTGYFLMARAAAGIMLAQEMGGCIINLSSKSGLQASKDNTPYNATKAAEIHMARGWAMELGPAGIRVNSVAPGNVFEGSRIWNPRYIRACARKYDIKPAEVIPYYVSRTYLKREIKGQDVADAVVFLCSDRARTITGQTLVPDSGQVFVR